MTATGLFAEARIDINAPTLIDAMRGARALLLERCVPGDGIVGHFGVGIRDFEFEGVKWTFDDRIPPSMIVAWHRQAVIPPNVTLRRNGVVWGYFSERAEDARRSIDALFRDLTRTFIVPPKE